MKLRLLFLFFFVTLALPAVAAAQNTLIGNFTNVASTSVSTSTQRSPRPACAITANPGAVYVGQSVTLRWDSQYATGGTITSLGSVGPSGSANVIPTANANAFQGTFTGPGGVGTCAIQISILQGIGGGTDSGGAGGTSGGGTSGGVPTQTQIRTGAGLIPCTGTDCQACHLAGLAQNIINWLVGISIPLAALMFAYAGVIYFTAGWAGWLGKVGDAHTIFTSVGVGFLIVICAWLGIQTILKAVLAPGFYQSWNTIQCVDESRRPKDKTIQQMLSIIPGLNTLVPATTPSGTQYYGNLNPSTGCLQGDYLQDGQCLGSFGERYSPSSTANCDPELGCFTPTYGRAGELCSSENPACSTSALEQLGFESQEARAMSCIAVTESGGNPFTQPSRTGACGLFQITTRPGNWSNPAYHGEGCSVSSSCNDPVCNRQTAQIMFNEQGYQPWTGIDPKTGVPWNQKARDCVEKYDPEAFYNQVL